MVAFAEAYADRNEQDYDALKAAVADGRIEARDDADDIVKS